MKHGSEYLDASYQQLECSSEIHNSEKAQKLLTEMCARWQKKILANAEYLIFLNFAANRSFNDPTQYPVFPWVITDYRNEKAPE